MPPPPASANATRLERAKVNLAYLALGSKATVAPSSIATRSFLTTLRYTIRYAIKRLIRYANGLAFFAAPSVGMGMAIGVITAVAKFGWRHRGNHFRWESMKARAQSGHDGAADEELDAEGQEAAKRELNRRRREDVWMRV
ncbi:hypothetical protein EHS25_005984 [Saitozyma podzolica]|uniref:Uncharacterized protein n=1 Tax=Saitozyma podzolica TaxID=1890683 RepID=A0A427XTV1_9TREE|nr:hypothetical protein EHS25_005984 [Saitozyma podzolica]